MQPTDHMSISVEYCFAPSNSSGHRYLEMARDRGQGEWHSVVNGLDLCCYSSICQKRDISSISSLTEDDDDNNDDDDDDDDVRQ